MLSAGAVTHGDVEQLPMGRERRGGPPSAIPQPINCAPSGQPNALTVCEGVCIIG